MSFLGIIIVNWNSNNQLYNCLLSVQRYLVKQIDFKIVIVDNGSTDRSIEMIEEDSFSFQLTILKQGNNLGFARACNLGASVCKDADYLLFLNPDTRIFNLSYVEIFKVFDKCINVGIVGIQLINEHNEVSKTCSRFPTAKSLLFEMLGLSKIFPRILKGARMIEFDHKNACYVDQIMGAFFLIQRNLFDELQGFDERFFVYYEEVDLSYRARQAGKRAYYFPGVKAFHQGGGVSAQIKDKRLFYLLRSKLLYIAKHFSWYQKILLFLMILFCEPITRGLFCFIKKDFKGVLNMINAYKMLYYDIFNITKSMRCK